MGFENAFWAFFALPLQNGMQLQQNAEPSHKADTTFSTHHRILPTMASLQGSTMFSGCLNATGSVDLVCIANAIEDNANMNAERVRTWLLVISATMVFLMQLGFAMLSAGCVRRKNASNLLLKNILDTSTACVGFFVLGYGLAFGGQDPNAGATFVGTSNFLLTGDVDLGSFFFTYACAAVAMTTIAGPMAASSILMVSWVYPIVAHSLWSQNGFLSPTLINPLLGVGCVDFAGSGVIHLTGGLSAFIAVYVLGPRRGRFYNSQGEPLAQPKEIPGHSISLQVLGFFILWFGWFGLNAGSSLMARYNHDDMYGEVEGLAATNTAIAGSSAAISALLTNMYQEMHRTGIRAFDISKTLNGGITGLVAITAGSGVLEPWAAALTGIIAAWVYVVANQMMIRWRIDDPMHGIPAHFFGSIWGLLAVGFLASPSRLMAAYGRDDHPGWFYSIGSGSFDANLLGAQITGIVFVVAWVSFWMFPFFTVLHETGNLRIDALEEVAGLDAAYKSAQQEDDEKLKQDIREEFKKFRKEEKRHLPTSSVDGASKDDKTRSSRRSQKSAESKSVGDKSVGSKSLVSSQNSIA